MATKDSAFKSLWDQRRHKYDQISRYASDLRPGEPFRVATCARVLGLSRVFVRQCWHEGLSDARHPDRALAPIRLRKERDEAVARESVRSTRAALAKNDALQTREDEALLVKATRSVAGKLMQQAIRLAGGAERLTHTVAARMRAADDLSIEESIKIINKVGEFAARTTDLVESAVRLERKICGEPESTVGLEVMDLDEAVAELLAGAKTVARFADSDVIDTTGNENASD